MTGVKCGFWGEQGGRVRLFTMASRLRALPFTETPVREGSHTQKSVQGLVAAPGGRNPGKSHTLCKSQAWCAFAE